MRGAMPSGCRLTRRALSGGASSSGATPSSRTGLARLPATSVPAAVDDDGRVGLVAAQDEVEGLAHRCHVGRVERALPVDGRVAGGEQQLVALAQRHLELLGQVQDHLAARRARPVSTKLTCRAETPASSARSSWLQPPPLAPVAQQRADTEGRREGDVGHGGDGSAAGEA